MARDRSLGLKLKAVDRISNTLDKVQGKFPKLTRAIKRASTTSKVFNAQTKQMRRTLAKVGGGLKSFGRATTLGVTLPLLAAGGAGVKAFGDFEQGLRGVEKTTGLSRETTEKLGRTFDNLSTKIPVTTGEMLELAQAGGQLGVKGVKDLEKFTITMSKLSRASDVAGEEGAKSIARILTVTGSGVPKIDKFASALVALGNSAAAGEGEILEVSNRVAGAIGRFDVGAEKVLGISTALKSLGKNAEASGSVVGRAFDSIDQSIKTGGTSFKVLEKLTGLTGDKLKMAFKEDAAGVFQSFIGGLNKVQTGGGNLIKVMEAVGLKGVRINDILGTLAKNPEVLAKNMDLSAKAFKENTALQNEFAVQTDSFNSEMSTLGNTFSSVGRLIGKDLAPAVKFLGSLFKKVAEFFRQNPMIRKVAVAFGVLAAVLGPVILALGTLVAMLPAIMTGLAVIGTSFIPVIAGAALFALKIGAVVAIISILLAKWDSLVTFFDQNPFLSLIKSAFLLLTPLGKILTVIKLISSAFQGLDAFKNTLRDVLPKFLADAVLGEKKLGPEKGAFNKQGGVPLAPQGQNVNGNIGVTFANAPAGTKVKSNFEGPLNFDLGFAGGPA